MKNQTTYYSLKDFELSLNLSATERAEEFQKYINQLAQFGYETYWIKSYSGIGAKMKLSQDREVISFVSNDYLGMSQRTETIQAGISALTIYGTGCLCSTSYWRIP
jgi:glycine C-acetyltransferase